MDGSREGSARVTCLGCRRPSTSCVCGVAPVVANRTGITIVQHPREARHAFNTARLARLALANVDLRPAVPGHPLGALPEGAGLLWPGATAVDLAAADPPPAHLVLIDGTWPQARTVFRDHPVLRTLPRYALDPEAPSRYQIRREPKAHYLSTIESIHAALGILEPDTPGLDRLLDGFLAMVDGQVTRDAPARQRSKVRTRPSLLDLLVRDWDRLVVGYAETVGYRGPMREATDVRWSAIRPSTGAVFAPEVLLPVTEGFARRWAAFAGPDAVVTSWSPHAVALLQRAVGACATYALRTAYGNLRQGIDGRLDEVTAREGCRVTPLPIDGRPGVRLAHAAALATFLRDAAAERQRATAPGRDVIR